MILEKGNLIFCSAGAPEQRNLFRESFVLIDNSRFWPYTRMNGYGTTFFRDSIIKQLTPVDSSSLLSWDHQHEVEVKLHSPLEYF